MEVFKEYRFEAAHHLPEVPDDHPCRRLHGHGYRVRVTVQGPVDDRLGWVVDFAALDAAFAPVHEALDHRLLNEVEGLDNPTCEILARWIWGRLADALPGLAELTVWETARAGCRLRAGDV